MQLKCTSNIMNGFLGPQRQRFILQLHHSGSMSNYNRTHTHTYILLFLPCEPEHVCKLLLAIHTTSSIFALLMLMFNHLAIISYKSIFKAWFEQQTHHHDYVFAHVEWIFKIFTSVGDNHKCYFEFWILNLAKQKLTIRIVVWPASI